MSRAGVLFTVSTLACAGCQSASHLETGPADIEQTEQHTRGPSKVMLPGFGIALGMTVGEVRDSLLAAGIPFEEVSQGQYFRTTDFDRKCLLPSLNERLASVLYGFENGSLETVAAELIGFGPSAIAPLEKPLKLKPAPSGNWIGLNGRVAVRGSVGDSETQVFVIRRPQPPIPVIR